MAETLRIGRVIARHLRAGDLVGLLGELGAGKTQLVRGLAQGLRVADCAVASPTFVMVHEYPPITPDAGGLVLVHVDAYRLQSLEDLESIGWPSSSSDPLAEMRRGAVVVVEWADRVADWLGEDLLEIRLAHQTDTQRTIAICGRGAWVERLPALLAELDQVAANPVVCPICQKPVVAGDKYFPFCGERCQLVDLGRWLGGNYLISRPIEQKDIEDGE